MHFNYYMPTRVIFGRGRLKELAQAELREKGFNCNYRRQFDAKIRIFG